MKKLFILLVGIFFIVGCSNNSENNGLISYMDAKELIINEGAILVDVRTADEYNERHIGGAVLLTLDSINEDTALNIINDKSTPIILYCKSGKRSSQAVIKFESLVYTEVYDLGSINNWKE